ncbi:MAG: hypothetical protein OQJ84_03470 [Xanthomonadales bacterium]|nr:hypothetical protein [Xanthomonadales bacterium]
MLINTIKQSYRGLLGLEDPTQAVVTVPVKRAAANADTYGKSEKRARRQRRMVFTGPQSSTGWRVTTW